jgi:murein DD-endopeptidase MepM/ murein hydrolase activator NlpD
MATSRNRNAPVIPYADHRPIDFRVERFDYAPADMLLRLSLRLSFEPARTRPMLLIEHDGVDYGYEPLVCCTGSAPRGRPDEVPWRGAFCVPPEIASGSRAFFALSLRDDLRLALPEPGVRLVDRCAARHRERSGHPWPYAVARRALLFVVSSQLLLAPVWSPAAALAEGTPGTGTGTETAPETPAPTTGGPTEPIPETTPQPSTEPAPPLPPAGGPTNPSPETPPAPPAPPAGVPSAPAPETPAALSTGAPAAAASSKAQPSPSIPSSSSTGARPHRSSVTATPIPVPVAPKPHRSATHLPSRQRADRHRHQRGDSGKAPQSPVLPASPSSPDPSEIPSLLSTLPPGLVDVVEEAPPAYLIPIYKEAGRRYDVPWRVLAAINQVETDYGRNLAVSPAGAVGWMQFMPATWGQWAVDADEDGYADPYSPRDAIFTAARYLQASGARHDLATAIFAYNHADWYVAEVLVRARMLGNVASFARVEKGYSLPLDSQYMAQLGRTDDGVDIETAPDGALVYSMTPGIVTAVASDPAGFGPNYPVIEATSGSLAGQHIYYGHVAEALVQPGQSVSAGQPIAIMGHTGDAASLGHGHIEIGFSDASGDPLSHHGAGAWTPAGDVMRSFLVTLSSAFGVPNS